MPNFLLRFSAAILCLFVFATADAATWYVKATGQHDGDGSEARPFHSLEGAETASGAGDTIYIVHTISAVVLDGQIVLKPDQKLIGLGPDVRNVPENAAGARITYSGGGGVGYPAGAVVQLSSGNEVANIHFKDFRFFGIVGIDVDFSGANIHDNLFTGGDIVENFEFHYSVYLESSSGNSAVTVTDNVVRNGAMIDGIGVRHAAASSGTYHFRNNHFDNIGGRAHTLLTFDTASIYADILDSSANNIGAFGEYSDFANADSILFQTGGGSIDALVQGYTYDNTDQVGGASNTGVEVFLTGDGDRVSLRIEDSTFSNAVTEAIQLNNLATNGLVEVEIRGTKVLNANPRQGASFGLGVGGAISVLPDCLPPALFNCIGLGGGGNMTHVLIEDSDIIGSTGYAVTVADIGGGFTSVIDLGGGLLGSLGQNRILDNSVGEVELLSTDVDAKNNWWGENTPRSSLLGGSSFNFEPRLLSDPRPSGR